MGVSEVTRQEVYRDIEQEFGFVPDYMKNLPDDTLEHDWNIVKALEFKEGKVPLKYKHLIGIGIAGATQCSYCAVFHTEMAKAHGATDDEIREVARYAMETSAWSTLLSGLQVDLQEFKDDIRRTVKFRKRKSERMEKVAM
jgi:AhpD family alkylhydroperoxidase